MHVNRLEFSNSEAEDNFEIMRVCMGKRNLAQSCVLYEVTPNKQVTCMWTTWNSQTQKRETSLKLWGFVWEREILLCAWVITFFRIPSSTLFSLSFLLFVIYPQLLAAAQITCLVTAAFSWATVQLLARTKYRDIRASGFGLRVPFVTLEN